jgi:hypothetical protein
MKVSDIIKKPNNKGHFQYYRNGEFHYTTTCGFDYTIPLDDADGVSLVNEEKVIFHMRWIRKQLATNTKAKG